MRKKTLLAQNISLFEQLEQLRAQNALKDKKIKELEEKLATLTAKKEEEPPKTQTEPLRRLEERIASYKKLQPDYEYASDVIGELVVSSANGSNTLTAGGNTEHRELVNLLLGRTEVAKAEILAIVTGEGDFEEKKSKIDAVREETLDYFSSVLAQIDPD